MCHGLETGGGDAEGEGDGTVEEMSCGGEGGDVDEDAGAETIFEESEGVFVDG